MGTPGFIRAEVAPSESSAATAERSSGRQVGVVMKKKVHLFVWNGFDDEYLAGCHIDGDLTTTRYTEMVTCKHCLKNLEAEATQRTQAGKGGEA